MELVGIQGGIEAWKILEFPVSGLHGAAPSRQQNRDVNQESFRRMVSERGSGREIVIMVSGQRISLTATPRKAFDGKINVQAVACQHVSFSEVSPCFSIKCAEPQLAFRSPP